MASDGSMLIDLIADLAEDGAAEEILERFGGSRVAVPAIRPSADNWLVGIVGFETAAAIFRAFHGAANYGHGGGLAIDLPCAERSSTEKNRREVYRRLKLGQTPNRIAREVGVHRRTVQRHRAALKKLARQNAASRTEGPSSC